jgi:hypothetical protein
MSPGQKKLSFIAIPAATMNPGTDNESPGTIRTAASSPIVHHARSELPAAGFAFVP